jgi:hypothetical protein
MGRSIGGCPGSDAVSPRGNPEGAVHGPGTFFKEDLAEKTEAGRIRNAGSIAEATRRQPTPTVVERSAARSCNFHNY